jgi:short-subunit dehydrogenase
MTRPLAVVTGASTGIGFELARCCVEDGYDAIVCADEPEIETAAAELRSSGAEVEAVQADLATEAGIDRLVAAIGERPVDALLANAGVGLGDAFLDQDLRAAENVVNLNVNGTIALIHAVGRRMRERGEGRILIVGSIAGFMPGSFQAVYNGTKAFLDSFSIALRNELKESGVTVTCLMPGATDTEFFERADMLDTPVGRSESKADPADVARKGYEAMKAGKSGVVTGFMNKVQTVFAGIIPDTVLAEMHRRTAEPGR